MTSGIGDKAELEAHGLGCIADAPELGKNLQVCRRLILPCRFLENTLWLFVSSVVYLSKLPLTTLSLLRAAAFLLTSLSIFV